MPRVKQPEMQGEKPVNATDELQLPSAIVEVPLGTLDREPDFRDHVNLQLTREETTTIRRIAVGLQQTKQRLPNDYPVRGRNDVVRWLLARVAEGVA